MPGPYLIGVDGGTQSSKVVVYDVAGNVVSQGRQALRPMSRPRPGVAVHPDDDLWDSIAAASREALAGFLAEQVFDELYEHGRVVSPQTPPTGRGARLEAGCRAVPRPVLRVSRS